MLLHTGGIEAPVCTRGDAGMVRCARLRRIMGGFGLLFWALLSMFLLAWVFQVMMCVGNELKPQPWSPSYHTVVRDCAENGWFSVTSHTLYLWGVLTATCFLLSEWGRRRRRNLQKGSEGER